MIAAAKEGTIGFCGEGCLHLLPGGLEMFLVRAFLGGVSPGNLLQAREELVVFGEALRHRAGGEERQGDKGYGMS